MIFVDLVCPLCTHDAGSVGFDENLRGQCPACQQELGYETGNKLLLPVTDITKLPHRQFARRVGRPARTKTRFKRNGDRLQAWVKFGVLTPIAKRIVLSPDGYESRTWRKRGSTYPLAALHGVLALTILVSVSDSRVHQLWCSALAFRHDEEEQILPLYVHSRDDATYFASVLNEHLEQLRRGGDPYRGQV